MELVDASESSRVVWSVLTGDVRLKEFEPVAKPAAQPLVVNGNRSEVVTETATQQKTKTP